MTIPRPTILQPISTPPDNVPTPLPTDISTNYYSGLELDDDDDVVEVHNDDDDDDEFTIVPDLLRRTTATDDMSTGSDPHPFDLQYYETQISQQAMTPCQQLEIYVLDTDPSRHTEFRKLLAAHIEQNKDPADLEKQYTAGRHLNHKLPALPLTRTQGRAQDTLYQTPPPASPSLSFRPTHHYT
jgi:hypothetical protein